MILITQSRTHLLAIFSERSQPLMQIGRKSVTSALSFVRILPSFEFQTHSRAMSLESLKTSVCIIGSGPAAHTAAIYSARAEVIDGGLLCAIASKLLIPL
jgi:alkyl hydroperoxide reductase subunit AhpF